MAGGLDCLHKLHWEGNPEENFHKVFKACFQSTRRDSQVQAGDQSLQHITKLAKVLPIPGFEIEES